MIKRWVKIYLNYAKGTNFNIAEGLSNRFLFGYTLRRFVNLIRGYLRFGTVCFIDKGIRIVCKSNLHLGKNITIGRMTEINCLGLQPTIIGEGSSLGSFGKLRSTATFQEIGQGINIGNYVGIGDHFYLGGFGGIKIGEGTIVGERFTVHSDNHNFHDLSTDIRKQGSKGLPVIIGNNCWIGSNVTVLGGVTLGDGCVIAAGAVVNKSFSENSIIGGIPARVLGVRGQR